MINRRKNILLNLSVGISDPLKGERVLDLYPSAAAAYSLRKLRTGETLAVNIRRDSDNATTDVLLEISGSITLSSTVSAGGTLGTWVGSNSAYVTTFYDQSGNGNDAIKLVEGEQHILVSSGVLVEYGGKSAISGISKIGGYSINIINDVTSFSVGSIASNNTVNYIIASSNGGYFYGGTLAGVNGLGGFDNINIRTTTGEDTNRHLGIFDNIGGDLIVHNNGDGGQNLGSFSSTGIDIIFGRDGATVTLNGYVQEIIIYDSSQTANITAIELDINNFYNIY